MIAATWLRGLAIRSRGRILGATGGVAIAVALLASIGAFLSSSKATMTTRAAAGVVIDWQLQTQPGADSSTVAQTVANSPGVAASLPVEFATTSGLQSVSSAGATETTGPGVVLGLPDGYRATFAGEIHDVAGSQKGVLLAQQTAANLHASPGDVIQLGRDPLPSVPVRVGGVVELPLADSLFQTVGAAAGSQPLAPPDNVLLLPAQQWHALFDPLAATRPDLVHHQLHVRVDHRLPADPSAAYAQETGRVHHLELALAGAAMVGDNLAATLDAARSDALYAQILFLFLGVPGAAVAALLTAGVAGAGAARRRGEQALLRARGATQAQLAGLGAIEAATVGLLGSGAGLLGAAVLGKVAFGAVGLGRTAGDTIAWAAETVGAGLLVALCTVAVPAWRDAKATSVATARRPIGRPATPRWSRLWIVGIVVAAGGAVFWLTGRSRYQLVLAPEGVPTISVSYWAFAGPALIWIGAALLTWRLADLALSRGRAVIRRLLAPLCGGLAGTVAASMARQRRVLARTVVLVALSASFAGSTAVFNATYRQQAEVDTLLTNGAAVTVTAPPSAMLRPQQAARVAALPGVRSVEPLQHRFAYVGADLQDLYGVRPSTIAAATRLQDAYFSGGSARQLMARLAAAPDSVLVSAETAKDFQLAPGDRLVLRLQDARTKQLASVPFHFAGIVKEFPTAPRDSFLVANADYVARTSGDDAIGALLIDTHGAPARTVANRVRTLVGPTATVNDITTTRRVVGSSLTAVDLAGLTRLELGFAIGLAAASAGLMLALGVAERRRTYAIAAALGADARQLGGFVWAEAIFVTVSGLVAGSIGGFVLSEMLVKVLTGVFDPPPAGLAVPWKYLVAVGGVTILAVATAGLGAVQVTRRPAVDVIRDL